MRENVKVEGKVSEKWQFFGFGVLVVVRRFDVVIEVVFGHRQKVVWRKIGTVTFVFRRTESIGETGYATDITDDRWVRGDYFVLGVEEDTLLATVDEVESVNNGTIDVGEDFVCCFCEEDFGIGTIDFGLK